MTLTIISLYNSQRALLPYLPKRHTANNDDEGLAAGDASHAGHDRHQHGEGDDLFSVA